MSHSSSNSCRVAILFRKGVDCVIHTKILDPLGHYIILKAAIKDKIYILINIYAPNKDKDITRFFNNLLITLQNENLNEEENIIVGGDFNCPLNTLFDKKGGIMIPRRSVVASIGCIQSELDLVDTWRLKNPSTKSYTWSRKSPNIFCPLDYWLISNNLHDLLKSVDIIPAIKTDHAAITLDFQNSANEIKGPGIWKKNCALLEDNDYINDVTSKTPIWLAQGREDLSNDRIISDWLKYSIRAHAKQRSKIKARERNKIPVLTEKQKLLCEGAISPEECALILDSFQNNKTAGNDGIPIEFYGKFWPIIGESFTKCANECSKKR